MYMHNNTGLDQNAHACSGLYATGYSKASPSTHEWVVITLFLRHWGKKIRHILARKKKKNDQSAWEGFS